MPNITIREVDTSTAGASEVTTNAVYVPGYAITGPVGEPTLCETLSEFQSIFGSLPYKYVVGTDTTGLIPDVQAGDYETSYVYAADLLRLGLPVMFERIAPGDDDHDWKASNSVVWTAAIPENTWQNDSTPIDTGEETPTEHTSGIDYYVVTTTGTLYEYDSTNSEWVESDKPFIYGSTEPSSPALGDWWYDSTSSQLKVYSQISVDTEASLTLKAIYPGESSTSIGFSVVKLTQIIDLKEYPYYQLTVVREANAELGLSRISGKTFFTFSSDLALQNSNIAYYDTLKQDKTGLVSFQYSSNINILEDPDVEVTLDITEGRLALTDTWYVNKNEFTPAMLYTAFNVEPSIFAKLEDKGSYVFKFITSGGYPVIDGTSSSIAYEMLRVACNRGDVTALIDYSRSLSINSESPEDNAYSVVNEWATTLGSSDVSGEPLGNYGAVFTPWCTFNSVTLKSQVTLAPSFAYLSAFANSTQTNANYYAVAGVVRGFIPNLVTPIEKISNSRSNAIQPRDTGVAINPIVEIKPYGNVIWGNRTLKNNTFAQELTATSFLNVRQLSNDVKRVTWVACKRCTFEPNSDALWITFRSQITPTLDQMVGNDGLTNYKITRLPTDKKATIVARITLYCIEAVEDFDITVELTDSQITIV